MTAERVLILNGGYTSEAEVSRSSGKACFDAACKAGWDAQRLEVDHTLVEQLITIKPTRIFNALHGQIGEDGNIQGLLNLMQIPYTHSGLLASAIAMDKPATKNILSPLGITFPEDIPFEVTNNKIKIEDNKSGNGGGGSNSGIVVKPRNSGSSIGIKIIPDYSDNAHIALTQTDQPMAENFMVERFIPGLELTVCVFNDEPITVTEIIPSEEFYDYRSKYSTGGSQHSLPADIPSHVFDACMQWAELAHRTLGCRGLSRSDFRWDNTCDALFMLEINTQPGMTSTSLVPEQAAHIGITMPDLVGTLLEAAQCD